MSQPIKLHLDKSTLQAIAGGWELLHATLRVSRSPTDTFLDDDDESEPFGRHQEAAGIYHNSQSSEDTGPIEAKSDTTIDMKLSMPGISLMLDLPPDDDDADDPTQVRRRRSIYLGGAVAEP